MIYKIPPLALSSSGYAGRTCSRSSQPVMQAPRSVVKSVYDYDGGMSSKKHRREQFLSNSSFPFFFQLQFARAFSRIEREKISQ